MSIEFFSDEFPGFQSGEASAVVDGQYINVPERLSYISFDSLSKSVQEEAYYKYKVIVLVNEHLQGGWTKKNIDPILDSLFEQGHIEKKPSWRSVARWHKNYDQDIGPKSLVSAKGLVKNPGNSKRDDADFYKRAVEEKFLKRERPHVSTAYYHYFNNILLYNRAHPDNAIEPITKSAFYKRVKKISPYEVEVGRFGKAEADKDYRVVNKFSAAERVMERVEIDHTPLDLILLDDTLLIPIGRPYLTILIDCHSRCIIGFYLSFQEPSYNSVRSAIMNACLSKEDVTKKYPMIKKDWPCQGKIETLVVDNGAEFWSKNLEFFCASVGINIEFNPVGKPWKKPLVERLFSIYNSRFVKEIPGTTFSNAQQLAGYKPEKDAILPFSYFIELMHIWIIDIYNQSPDSRMTRIPALSWEIGCKKYPPPLYSGFEEKIFKIEAFPTELCTLRRGGISIDRIDYTNEELVEYRKITPPPPGSKVVKVVVKRDPEDVSYIYVYLVERKEYIRVPAVDPDRLYDGLSVFQLKVRRKLRRNFINSKTDYVGIAEAEKLIDDRVSEIAEEVSASKKKIKGTKKAAAYFGISSENPSSIIDGFTSREISDIEKENKSHSGVNPNDEEWKRISDDLEPYS